jgi:hypothetical protein
MNVGSIITIFLNFITSLYASGNYVPIHRSFSRTLKTFICGFHLVLTKNNNFLETIKMNPSNSRVLRNTSYWYCCCYC